MFAAEPFGRAKTDPKAQVTDVGDPVALVLSLEGHGSAAAVAEKMTAKGLTDLDAALKRESQRAVVREKIEDQQAAAAKQRAEQKAEEENKPARFQARSGPVGSGNSMAGPKQEVCSLRISNLSEETKEEALRLLCQKIGKVSKVYVPTVTVTNANGTQEKRGKGYAFVTFSNKREAEEAMKKLDRLPFQHSLLSVEWGAK
jgi:RNA recognition motif-containing protein